ncbi:MAG: rhodanese-like domain-containing protein [Bacteroidota bacterium]
MKLYSLFVFALLLFACNTEQPAGIHLLNPQDFESAINSDQVKLIDIRTAEEFQEGSIAYAQNIDFYAEDFMDQMGQFDKSEPLYIFCRSGGRSGKASKMLVEAGFNSVYDLDGGYLTWSDR